MRSKASDFNKLLAVLRGVSYVLVAAGSFFLSCWIVSGCTTSRATGIPRIQHGIDMRMQKGVISVDARMYKDDQDMVCSCFRELGVKQSRLMCACQSSAIFDE